MPTFHVTLDDGRAYNIEAEKPPSQEEAASAIADFHDRPSSEQSLGGGIARGAAPGVAGFYGGAGGAAAATALAPETGGLSLLLPIAGAIGGSLLGYGAAKSGQDYLANKYAPKSVFSTASEQRDVQTNPYSEMTGNLLSAGGLPNPAALLRGGESVLTQSGRQVLRDTLNIVRTVGPQAADPKGLELLNNVLHIAGNSGVGVAQGALEGQHPGDIALNTAGMMLFNEGWLQHPNHGVNTETFKNAVQTHEPGTQDVLPPETPNAPQAVSEPLGGNLDEDHQKVVEQINSSPVAKIQDQLVTQLDQSGAPKTAAVLDHTKEESRDIAAMAHLKAQADDQAEIEHKAEVDATDRHNKAIEDIDSKLEPLDAMESVVKHIRSGDFLLSELPDEDVKMMKDAGVNPADRQQVLEFYEGHLKAHAAAQEEAPTGKAPEGAGAEPVTEQEVTPEVVSGTGQKRMTKEEVLQAASNRTPIPDDLIPRDSRGRRSDDSIIGTLVNDGWVNENGVWKHAITEWQNNQPLEPNEPQGHNDQRIGPDRQEGLQPETAQGGIRPSQEEVTPTQPTNEETNTHQESPQGDRGLQDPQAKEVNLPKIISATFEHKGQTYEGKTHLDAVVNSGSRQKSRFKSRTSREDERFGFTVQHPDGITETMDRQRANELAHQNGQIIPDAQIKGGMLHSDHLQGDWAQPEEDRPVPPLNRKDEYGVPLFESKEEFDAAYANDHDQEMKETPEEFLLKKHCE